MSDSQLHPEKTSREGAAPDPSGETIFDNFDAPSAEPDRQTLLAEELHHRVQNTLAVVLALARLTARSVTTIDEFQTAFGNRIQAMARTNALLLRTHNQATSARKALEVELEPYAANSSQVTLECAPLALSADTALSFSLIIHELATNAAKYGALSTPEGRLLIRCEGGAAGGVLSWWESAPGLPVQDRIAGGGSRLIERLAADLGGAAHIALLPHGLEATISFRLDARRRAITEPDKPHL
jgi:two-component sensor histidine kinase